MNSYARFCTKIRHINELAEKLDPNGRTFLFMDWNPLYNETDTAESKFWQEWINLHILLRECRPGQIKYERDKTTFFSALGYTNDEIRDLQQFTNLLRNLRLYRCHPNLEITPHYRRKANIQSFFDTIPELHHLQFEDWQIRTEASLWQQALQWLYDETERHLSRLEHALNTLPDQEMETARNAWILSYAEWFGERNALDLFVYPAIHSYWEQDMLHSNNRRMSAKEARDWIRDKVKMVTTSKILMDAIKEEFLNMDDFHTFEPEELSYEVVRKVLSRQE